MFIYRYHTWVWTGRKPENEIYRPIGSESRVSYHMVISLKKFIQRPFSSFPDQIQSFKLIESMLNWVIVTKTKNLAALKYSKGVCNIDLHVI